MTSHIYIHLSKMSMRVKNCFGGRWDGSIFILRYISLKIAVLLHKTTTVVKHCIKCKYLCCNRQDFLLYLIPRCTEDVLLTTKCCIQRIAVLWLKYILFAVVFTSFSPTGQIDLVELKYIKSVIKSKSHYLQLHGAITGSSIKGHHFRCSRGVKS